ncbi:MAG: hypothetical protein IH621_16845 [Krumholzibacteria bacterium]|nr:hypothetical protein [Candidatus Krumholzibacteria bacterium]
MPIGSIAAAGRSTAYAGVTSVRAANDLALGVLQRQADERAELEYLREHLLVLKDALSVIREHWRRSDQPVAAGAARALSRAVLAQPGDETLPLRDLEGFGDVGAGTLTAGGTGVAFDPVSDSLADLIARLNAAGAGVTAALDDTGQRLVITADDPAADLTLDDGGTGLLAALGIAEGTRGPAAAGRTPAMSWSRAGKIAEALGDAVAAVNAVFSAATPGDEPSSHLVRSRGDLQKAFEDSFAADTTGLARDVGFHLNFETEGGEVLSFTDRAARDLVRALRSRPSAAEVMLFGTADKDGDGLVGRLELRVGLIENRLETTFAQRGYTFDAYA